MVRSVSLQFSNIRDSDRNEAPDIRPVTPATRTRSLGPPDGRQAWSERSYSPERPPDLCQRVRSPINISRSTALHMS